MSRIDELNAKLDEFLDNPNTESFIGAMKAHVALTRIEANRVAATRLEKAHVRVLQARENLERVQNEPGLSPQGERHNLRVADAELAAAIKSVVALLTN